MLDALGPSDETTYVLVVPLIQTALAEVGSGDRAAGLWHWHMAQTLFPKSAESDLSAFGEPGVILKNNILPSPNPEKCPRPPSEATTPPAVISTAEPSYPRGAVAFGNQGLLIVAAKIGADGSVTEPRVVKPLPTPLAYAALEALRRWRFKPAMVDGAAVESTFCLTINYRLK